MNVTAQYPVRGSRGFDDQPSSPSRGKQARFDSHDDFYSFLESNRGPGGIDGGLATAIQLPSQSQQPRTIPNGHHGPPPGDHSRPPIANQTFQPQRSGSGRSRPPSYTGSRSEELLVNRNGDNSRKSGENLNKITRHRRGTSRPITAGGPSSNDSPTHTAGSSPRQHADGRRPTSSDSLNPQSAGASIERLKSPSVMSCVLQPLNQKVKEYNNLMHKEQDEMARLDEELRGLQERRAQAENRFLDAKCKHDDYHRQYQDVERALRGEVPIPREPSQRPMMQQPINIRDEEEEEFDDEEDFAPIPPQRRVNSQQSFGRSSQKVGMGARFRNSLFGRS